MFPHSKLGRHGPVSMTQLFQTVIEWHPGFLMLLLHVERNWHSLHAKSLGLVFHSREIDQHRVDLIKNTSRIPIQRGVACIRPQLVAVDSAQGPLIFIRSTGQLPCPRQEVSQIRHRTMARVELSGDCSPLMTDAEGRLSAAIYDSWPGHLRSTARLKNKLLLVLRDCNKKTGKSKIWIAHGPRIASTPKTESRICLRICF